MIRVVSAELRKLANPIVLVVVVVMLGAFWANAKTTSDYARLQVPVAVASAQRPSAQALCSTDKGKTLVPCPHEQRRQAMQQALNTQFAQNGSRLGAVSNSLRTWPGMFRFVVHQMATGLGWLLVALLVALHTAGEWRSGTAATTLLAVGSFRRFWIAKILSVWVLTIGISVAAATALYAVRGTLGALAGVPDPPGQTGDVTSWQLSSVRADPEWSSWHSVVRVLVLGCLVWLVMTSVTTGMAMVLRKPMLTLVAAVATLSAALIFAVQVGATSATVFPTVERLFDLQDTPYGVRDVTLWTVPARAVDIGAPHGAPSAEAVVVVLWGLFLIGLALALMRVARRPQLVA